jgi:putative aminopeptidase FrvX
MTTEVNETVQLIQKLVSIPSPSGNTEKVIGFVERFLQDLNIETKRNRKGGLIATIKGTDDKEHRMLTAHVDTLGAMVKVIK